MKCSVVVNDSFQFNCWCVGRARLTDATGWLVAPVRRVPGTRVGQPVTAVGFDGGSRVGWGGVVVAGLGEAVGAHVAPGDGPLVGLLGEQGADEADHGGPVGEDAHDVGAPADLLVEAFLRVVGADLGPVLDGEGG